MNMHRLLLSTALVLATLSNSVYAHRDDDRGDSRHDRDQRHHRHDHRREHRPPQVVYVPVIHVQPVIEVVRGHRPRRDCWQSSTTTISQGSATGTILGGVIGGVIGHELAGGHHEDLGILAGTLLGASVGHDLSGSTRRAVPETRTHCESYYDGHDEQRVVGYDVTYHYHGRAYVQRTHRRPGSRIQITVNFD